MSTRDYYEILQVNQKADAQTIERVFRHLAKQFHPDNQETGDPDRFNLIVEAFRVLSDPEARVEYDVKYDNVRREEWKVLDQASAGNNVEADRRLRIGILTLLYTARRKDVNDPGMGSYELEQTLGCLEHIMAFHIWYLKESGWVERLQNGQYAITVAGVEKLTQTDIPWRSSTGLLTPGADTQEGGDGSPTVTPTPDAAPNEDAVEDELDAAEPGGSGPSDVPYEVGEPRGRPFDDENRLEAEDVVESAPRRSRVIA